MTEKIYVLGVSESRKMKFSWTPPFFVATGKFTLSKPVPNLIREEKKPKKPTIERVSYKVTFYYIEKKIRKKDYAALKFVSFNISIDP